MAGMDEDASFAPEKITLCTRRPMTSSLRAAEQGYDQGQAVGCAPRRCGPVRVGASPCFRYAAVVAPGHFAAKSRYWSVRTSGAQGPDLFPWYEKSPGPKVPPARCWARVLSMTRPER